MILDYAWQIINGIALIAVIAIVTLYFKKKRTKKTNWYCLKGFQLIWESFIDYIYKFYFGIALKSAYLRFKAFWFLFGPFYKGYS